MRLLLVDAVSGEEDASGDGDLSADDCKMCEDERFPPVRLDVTFEWEGLSSRLVLEDFVLESEFFLSVLLWFSL